MFPIVTIVGASGFLGRNLTLFFRKKNFFVIEINKNSIIDINKNYGTVFYCAGICVNFEENAFRAIETHVANLEFWLKNANIDRFIYFSSARIYLNQENSSERKKIFKINKCDIYAQTKLLGEFVCLSSKVPIIILRLSNIIGYDKDSPYFLWSIFRQAKQKKHIFLQENQNSMRDYIWLDDFLIIAEKILTSSFQGIFNISSSINLKHKDLQKIINDVVECKWEYGNKKIKYPLIKNRKIKNELDIHFSHPNDFIKKIFHHYINEGTINE